ncbi:MAG: dienelactone hydrolase family protein [Longimicrobiaceae bacterium]
MRSAKAIVAVTSAAAAVLACDGNPVERNGDSHLTLSADSVVVGVYESLPLTATVRDAGGAIQHVAVRYVSRDESVAAVNAAGAITAMAVGSTYVVATLPDRPDVRDSVRVRVHADSCSGARPDFGALATAGDRDLFGYDVDAPLNLQTTVESTNNGVEASSISFSSPDGGLVTGMMWDPVARPGPRPGMVLLHGMPGNARDMSAVAQSYARYGAVVIAIDAPFARRAGPVVRFTAEDRAEQIQLIRDLQRAVDVLRSRPNVDDGRIAYMGVSYGGAMGALFVGVERRLAAAALVVGHGGLVSHSTGPDGFKYISGLPCAMRSAWIRAMAPIEPIRFIGHAAIPLLLQNGTLDTLIPSADAAELHAAAPQPRTVRWYTAGHNLDQQAVDDRHEWLVEKVGIDPR